MTGRLAGKKALITAAGSGIGRESVLAFLNEGAVVFALDIDSSSLSTLPDCHRIVADLTDPSTADAIARDVGGVDVLFNCAGRVDSGSILECDDDQWERALTLNLTAAMRLTRSILPGMIERGGGSIINMSSVASSLKGVANRFSYGATKAGVIGMTKAIAADFVRQGIRCNAICPGTVDTPSLQQRIAGAPGDYDTNWKAFLARQPMGRLGATPELAALAVYLASDESAFTTGTVHIIDGGWVNI